MKSTNLLGLSLMAATVAVGNDEHVKADRDKSATRAGCRLMAVSQVTNSQAPAAVRSFAAEREGFEPSVRLPVHRFSRPVVNCPKRQQW